MSSLVPETIPKILLEGLGDENIPQHSAPLWLKILVITFSGGFQFFSALIILIAYWRSERFRRYPGNIILGFAISSLALAVLWTLNWNEIIIQNEGLCQWVGFFAIFFEYNCIFYEIGIIYYFICYYKQAAKPFPTTDFPQRHMNIARFNTYRDELKTTFRYDTDIYDQQYRQNVRPALEGENPGEADAPEDENLGEIDFSRVNVPNELKEKLTRMATELRETQQELSTTKEKLKKASIVLLYMQEEHTENLKHKKDNSYAAMHVQAKIHCCVLVTSLFLSIIPAICGELGLDYYGACSKEWDDKESQVPGIILTVFVMGASAIASGIGLTYFRSQKKTREAVFEDPVLRRPPVDENITRIRRVLTKEEEHYLKHLWLYVIFTTIFGWLLAATNIYADKVTDRNSSLEDLCFIIHFLMIALQGLVLLVLKLTEPMTIRAINQALGRQPANGDDLQQALL